MKVLTIGTDKKLFDMQSAVLSRQIEYASKMDELHIIVCNDGPMLLSQHIGNLYLHPTNSKNRVRALWDAYVLGKKILTDNIFVAGGSIISAQDPFENGLIGYILSRKFSFPLQVQVHTDFLSPYFKTNFLNTVRVQIARFLMPRAANIRVVSMRIALSLNATFTLAHPPSLLPVYIDISKIQDQGIQRDIRTDFPQFKFVMFMASRLTKEKQIDTALLALQKVVDRYPHVGLVLAGEGPERAHLIDLAHTLGISKNVAFIGWQDDLISYYKTAHVFLLTSQYEGYGMTLIEAAASGCPIITTHVGVAGDIFEDDVNAFVCPVGDVTCFTGRIRELMSDNAKRELFKLAVSDSIQSMSLSREQYVAQYIQIFTGMLKQAVPESGSYENNHDTQGKNTDKEEDVIIYNNDL